MRLASGVRRASAVLVLPSILREDFAPDSDVDLLVAFEHGADWSLLDHVAMEEELSGIIGRKG